MRHPLLLCLLPLSLGIILSRHIPVYPPLQGEVGMCLLILLPAFPFLIRSHHPSLLRMLTATVLLLAGLLLSLHEQQVLTPPWPSYPVGLRGSIVEVPVHQARSCQYVVQPEQELPRLLVRLPRDSASLRLKAGDALQLQGRIQLPPAPEGTKFNYRQYLQCQRIGGILTVTPGGWHPISPIPLSFPTRCLVRAQQLRHYLLERLRSTGLPPRELALAEALTLGYKADLSPEARRAYSATGLSHLLALSGMHIGLIVVLLTLLFPRHRCPSFIRLPLLLAGTWGFIFIAGLPTSAVRAGWMMTLLLLHPHPDERHHALDSCSLAALLMLIIHPMNLFDVGFQLSFAAVAGILLITPLIPSLPHVPRRLHQLFSACLSAQLMVIPLTLWHFGEMPLYFLLTNLPVTGLLFPLVMYLSMALLVTAVCCPTLSPILAWLLQACSDLQHLIIHAVQQLPGHQLYFSGFGPAELLSSYLIIGLLIHYLRQRNTRRLIALQVSIILFLALLLR